MVNEALHEQENQIIRYIDYQRLVVENRQSQEKISILEGEVKLLKEELCKRQPMHEPDHEFDGEVRVSTPFENVGDEVACDSNVNSSAKATSNIITRMKDKPRKRVKSVVNESPFVNPDEKKKKKK
uniref:Uncharacterized protein LOC105852071 n=1 Tax=Cicer arietinum TaxID=3827 RepID=A0A3Q7YAY4_CICAR|nr:uncharacterized protein LOC105852071 [Cicer arietinum]